MADYALGRDRAGHPRARAETAGSSAMWTSTRTRADPPLWWCDLKVAPDARCGCDRSRARRLARAAHRRGRVRVWTSATDARVVAAFERLGFAPVRHSYRMEIDLADETPEPVWPSGISVRTLAEGEERRIHEAFLEVWQDTSDPPNDTFEDWATGCCGRRPSSLRCGFLLSPATSSPVSRSAGRTPTIRLRDTSSCSVSGGPGASRGSATRCCCTRSRRSGSGAGHAARSASTRRARPERPGSTSGPA